MKKKNMIKLCRNISKIKYAMVEKYSIVDNEDLLKDLIENKTDITDTKEVDKMADTILYLIENDSNFTKEIENEIIKNVKKILYVNDNVVLNSIDMLSILNNNNVLINNDDFSSYQHDIVNLLELKKDNKLHSYIRIPCTSNLQKHLFIEFNLLTNKNLEQAKQHDITDVNNIEIEAKIIEDLYGITDIYNIDIRITDIYID